MTLRRRTWSRGSGEGNFPVESRKKECHKYCDYHAVCRVKEVRFVGKTWAERPSLEVGE